MNIIYKYIHIQSHSALIIQGRIWIKTQVLPLLVKRFLPKLFIRDQCFLFNFTGGPARPTKTLPYYTKHNWRHINWFTFTLLSLLFSSTYSSTILHCNKTLCDAWTTEKFQKSFFNYFYTLKFWFKVWMNSIKCKGAP